MKFLIELWNNYIVNLLDILVVSLIFYYLLVLIKGTRAVQVLRGLLILFVATMIAPILQFHTVGWILEKFWVAGIIAIVIVFQPELRTALANLSSVRLVLFDDVSVYLATLYIKRRCCGSIPADPLLVTVPPPSASSVI